MHLNKSDKALDTYLKLIKKGTKNALIYLSLIHISNLPYFFDMDIAHYSLEPYYTGCMRLRFIRYYHNTLPNVFCKIM